MTKEHTAVKKTSLFHLAVRNLTARRRILWICLLFYLSMAAGLTSVNLLVNRIQHGVESAVGRMGADLVIVPSDYYSSIENALFQGYPCTVYFDHKWMDQLEQVEGIKQMTSQIFLATLSAECCDDAVQLVAYDEKSDYLIGPWIEGQIKNQLKSDQVVVGSNLKLEVGDSVTYYGRTFEVAGRLEATGMGYDSSVFLTQQAARELAASETAKGQLLLANQPDAISSIMIQVEDGYSIEEVKKNITESYQSQQADLSEITMESSTELFRTVMESVSGLTECAVIMKVILIGMTILALSGLNLVVTEGRRKELGIYLTLGADKARLSTMLFIENSCLSIVGGIGGVLVASILFGLFQNLIQSSLKLPYLPIGPGIVIRIGIQTVLLTFVTGIITMAASVHELLKQEQVSLVKDYEMRN